MKKEHLFTHYSHCLRQNTPLIVDLVWNSWFIQFIIQIFEHSGTRISNHKSLLGKLIELNSFIFRISHTFSLPRREIYLRKSLVSLTDPWFNLKIANRHQEYLVDMKSGVTSLKITSSSPQWMTVR